MDKILMPTCKSAVYDPVADTLTITLMNIRGTPLMNKLMPLVEEMNVRAIKEAIRVLKDKEKSNQKKSA